MFSKKRTPEFTPHEPTDEIYENAKNYARVRDFSENTIGQIGQILTKRYTDLDNYRLDESVYAVNPQSIALPKSYTEASGNAPRFGRFTDGAMLSFATRPGILMRQHTFRFPIEKRRVGEIAYSEHAIESDCQTVDPMPIDEQPLDEILTRRYFPETIGRAALLLELLSSGALKLDDGNAKAFEKAYKKAWPTLIDLEGV